MVLCNGTFDPLHYGHLIHLEEARSFGDRLVVALTSDASVRREKGANRPLFTQEQRSRMLMALRCVHRVKIVDGLLEALFLIQPDVLVKGSDYVTGLQPAHAQYCSDHGIDVVITNAKKWSATEIGNELRGR